MITIKNPVPISLAALLSAVGHTWFKLEENTADFDFVTRENGDIGEDETGDADVQEARRIAKVVRTVFPKDIDQLCDDIYDELGDFFCE